MYIYGASGHAKVIIDIAEACNRKIDGIIDRDPAKEQILGYEVTQAAPLENKDAEYFIAIGNCGIRRRISKELKGKFATLIHPSAIISPRASIGEGSVVMQGAVVQADARIGKHCIINTRASIDHECQIGDYVHIAPGCTVSGNVKIGECTWLGVGATVIQGVSIGRDCFIGAGAVVVADIPDGSKAYGVPCRVIEKTNE